MSEDWPGVVTVFTATDCWYISTEDARLGLPGMCGGSGATNPKLGFTAAASSSLHTPEASPDGPLQRFKAVRHHSPRRRQCRVLGLLQCTSGLHRVRGQEMLSASDAGCAMGSSLSCQDANCKTGCRYPTCADSSSPPLFAPACPNCTSLLNSLAQVPLQGREQGRRGGKVGVTDHETSQHSGSRSKRMRPPGYQACPPHLTQATTGLVMRPALSASTRLYSSRPAAGCKWQRRCICAAQPSSSSASSECIRRRQYIVWPANFGPPNYSPPISPSTTIILTCMSGHPGRTGSGHQAQRLAVRLHRQHALAHNRSDAICKVPSCRPTPCLRDVLVTQAVVGQRGSWERVAANGNACVGAGV